MATRAEVIQKIRSYGDVEDLGDGSFKVLWELDGGRSQIVFMNVNDMMLMFVSPFASKDDITASTAIGMAVIFGVCEVGDFYALRNVSLIEDLDESEIVNMAMVIAMRADALESEVGGDRF